jgi:uncharacterized protein (TIGR03067 family)
VRVEDAGELQGEWEVISCRVGRTDYTAFFEGDRWVFSGPSAGLIDVNGVRYVGSTSFRVDLSFNPPHIDAAHEDGSRGRGVYRRTGDVLEWVEDADGGRPPSFDPAAGVYLWTLRRVKK